MMKIQNTQIAWRLVILVFAITLLQTLPAGQLPTLTDFYHAVVLAAVAGLTLIERTPPASSDTNIPKEQN